MKNNQLKEALDRRYAALEASPERRARILAAAERQSTSARGGKMRLTLVLAMVTLLALGSAGVAAGINLFTRMAEQNEELGRVADVAVVTDNPVFVYDHEKIGRVEGAITNAYFDGDSLKVGYYISNYGYSESWLPVEDEYARLVKLDENPYAVTLEMIEEGILTRDRLPQQYLNLKECVDSGLPWGMVSYSAFYGDMHANDIEVAYGQNWYEIFSEPEPQLYEVVEYEKPLPEILQGQMELKMNLPVILSEVYEYFDGQDWYLYSEKTEIGALTATVSRTPAE